MARHLLSAEPLTEQWHIINCIEILFLEDTFEILASKTAVILFGPQYINCI